MTPSILELDPVLNPRKAECQGLYLYGAGYFASEDQQAAIVRAEHSANFCHECPAMRRCIEEHKARVRELHPEEVAAFEELCAKAERKGMTPLMVAAALTRQGTPDPFQAVALSNFRKGREHRRRRDG